MYLSTWHPWNAFLEYIHSLQPGTVLPREGRVRRQNQTARQGVALPHQSFHDLLKARTVGLRGGGRDPVLVESLDVIDDEDLSGRTLECDWLRLGSSGRCCVWAATLISQGNVSI